MQAHCLGFQLHIIEYIEINRENIRVFKVNIWCFHNICIILVKKYWY